MSIHDRPYHRRRPADEPEEGHYDDDLEHEDNDDDATDPEAPDPSDTDADDDDAETEDCPHCGRAVYEGAERCPECGQYLGREDAPRRTPWWIIVTALVLLAIILLTWL